MKTSTYGFIKVASAIPNIKVADCQWNISHIESLIEEAEEQSATVVLFPELSITGYTCGDLFLSQHLQEQALVGLQDILLSSKNLKVAIIVGLPININNQIFNCAAVIHKGKILSIVPKTYLPNYKEFYEMRWFTSSQNALCETIDILGQNDIPFGSNQIIDCEEFKFGIELCEDLWAPVPPSSYLSIAGAEIIFNLSASNELLGKHKYLLELIKQQSARCISGYVYSSAGIGESSTDLVYTGNAIISENGTILSKSKRFCDEQQIVYSEIDLECISSERQNNTTFKQGLTPLQNNWKARYIKSAIRVVPFNITRKYPQNPFIPDTNLLKESCQEIFNIQVAGLSTRLRHINIPKMIIGVSGGLDSTLALLVCAKTCDRLNIDRNNIIGVTMPGFGTTTRTYTNATEMITKLGCTLIEIPIKEACMQHFKDINHNADIHDITYENSQARERTQILMDLSNKHCGIVIGTGDLSELALGWATYNGDQMSMYAVNTSIPKTLIKHLVAYVSDNEIEEELRNNLSDVINTPVSPELLPAQADGTIAQITEDLVGPYQLHDFFIYYTLKYGFSPEKIKYLAEQTFKDIYTIDTISHWIKIFYRRFFNQQFKRSCMPDGPKTCSISLSPRGDWRMPSDASSRIWLDNLL